METNAKEQKNDRVLTPLLPECQTIAALVPESGCKSRAFDNNTQIYMTLFLKKKSNFLLIR